MGVGVEGDGPPGHVDRDDPVDALWWRGRHVVRGVHRRRIVDEFHQVPDVEPEPAVAAPGGHRHDRARDRDDRDGDGGVLPRPDERGDVRPGRLPLRRGLLAGRGNRLKRRLPVPGGRSHS